MLIFFIEFQILEKKVPSNLIKKLLYIDYIDDVCENVIKSEIKYSFWVISIEKRDFYVCV